MAMLHSRDRRLQPPETDASAVAAPSLQAPPSRPPNRHAKSRSHRSARPGHRGAGGDIPQRECVLSLQLRRDCHALIAYSCDPARAKTVDQQSEVAPLGQLARPDAIMRANAIAAME